MKRTIASMLGVALLVIGCSTWQDTTGKSLVTIATTVDAAMKGWETYSVRTGLADNDPTELKVKNAYIMYQSAFQVAITTYDAAVNSNDSTGAQQAITTLTAAEQPMLNLISSLTSSTNSVTQ